MQCRGCGKSSTGTSRASKRSAVVTVETKDGNDSAAKRSKVPQHQLMLKETNIKKKTAARKEIPTSQAIVQVETSNEVPTS